MNQLLQLKLILPLAFFLLTFTSLWAGDEAKESRDISGTFVSLRLGANDISVDFPGSVTKGGVGDVHLAFRDPANPILSERHNTFSFIVNGKPEILTFTKGEATFKHVFSEPTISIYCDDFHYDGQVSFSHIWVYGAAGASLVVIIAAVSRKKKKA